jgi:hypothetical protein
MWQALVVAPIVIAALAYAAWALVPVRARFRLLDRARSGLLAAPGGGLRNALRARIVEPLLARARLAPGCGGCSAASVSPTIAPRK